MRRPLPAALTFVKNIPLDVGTLERGGPRGGIERTPDGKYAYVTHGPLGTIAVIDAATLDVTRTIGGFGRADSSGHFIGPAPLRDAVEYYNPVLRPLFPHRCEHRNLRTRRRLCRGLGAYRTDAKATLRRAAGPPESRCARPEFLTRVYLNSCSRRDAAVD
jgi:YVTN family beta-propeller protein